MIKTIVLTAAFICFSAVSASESPQPYETTHSSSEHTPSERYASAGGGTFKSKIYGAKGIVPAQGDAENAVMYLNMGELYQHWHENDNGGNPYPDYVCGAWSADGTMNNLTVAVTKDEKGEAGKKEILGLIADDTSVSFTYQSYSYAELNAVMEEILPVMGDESGVYGLGIYEMDNVVHADIDTSNPNSGRFMEDCLKKYGAMIRFEGGEGIAYTEIGADDTAAVTTAGAVVTMDSDSSEAESSRLLIYAIAVLGVLFLGGLVYVIRTARVRQTNIGTITENTALSKRETEELLRNTAETPPPDIFGSITDELDKE